MLGQPKETLDGLSLPTRAFHRLRRVDTANAYLQYFKIDAPTPNAEAPDDAVFLLSSLDARVSYTPTLNRSTKQPMA